MSWLQPIFFVVGCGLGVSFDHVEGVDESAFVALVFFAFVEDGAVDEDEGSSFALGDLGLLIVPGGFFGGGELEEGCTCVWV